MSGTSTYRGVSWHTQTSRWKAQIKVAGKDVNLGRHRDEVEAARAYDRAAICARGTKDAKLNFGIDDYKSAPALSLLWLGLPYCSCPTCTLSLHMFTLSPTIFTLGVDDSRC